jgi:aminoglycoside phosphotransferase (APT) family kinase protein
MHLASLDDLPFDVPKVLDLDEPAGVVTWSRLEGDCLHDLLADDERLVEAARAAGRALRGLHGCEPAPDASVHDAGAEIAMLAGQLDRLRALEPSVFSRLGDMPGRVFETLAQGSCGAVPLHRDFHDKQVFVDAAGRPGILDFDTMAMGEPALDVANMLVHLELRALQKRCSPDAAGHAAEAFLGAYGPDAAVRQRLAAYEAATRLRLACLYTWRPAWRHLGPALLSSISLPCPPPQPASLSCSSWRPSHP